MVRKFDFLVIGSGIAGMSFALKVAHKGKVALICKSGLEADSPAYRIFVAWFSSYGFIEQFLNVRKGYRHFENTK